MRTTARHPLHPSRPRARLALVLSALFAALLAAAAWTSSPHKPITYSGTWQGLQVKLSLVNNPPLVRLTGLTP